LREKIPLIREGRKERKKEVEKGSRSGKGSEGKRGMALLPTHGGRRGRKKKLLGQLTRRRVKDNRWGPRGQKRRETRC